MRLIKTDKDKYTFEIAAKEKRLLCKLLELYPMIPAGYQKLSRATARPEDQQLLEEALNAQRSQNRLQALALVNAKSRFRPNKNGYHLSLSHAQMESLLQVLNDIRIGSWLLLGSPEGPAEIFASLNDKTAPHFWAMELSGEFQMCLIHALAGEGAPPSKAQESE